MAVGGILFLLPFLAFPYGGGDMDLQFAAPKLWGAFFLGNLAFAFYLGKRIHPAFGLAHFGLATSVLFTGFGTIQLYPYAYWTACAGFTLWVMPEDRIIEAPCKAAFIFKCIAVAGILVALHAYVQAMGYYWGLKFQPGIDERPPLAFFGQHTKLGSFLAMVAPLCLVLRWYPAAAFIAFIALLTGSSFTFLAMISGFLVWLRYVRGRRLVLGIVFLGFLSVGTLYLVRPTAQVFFPHGRFQAWADLLKGHQEAPILGYGPGSFRLLFPSKHESQGSWERNGGHFAQAHNDYLQVLYEAGRYGASFLLVVLGFIAWAYWKTWWCAYWLYLENRTVMAQVVLAPILVNALGNFPWQMSPQNIIGVFCAGILLRALRA